MRSLILRTLLVAAIISQHVSGRSDDDIVDAFCADEFDNTDNNGYALSLGYCSYEYNDGCFIMDSFYEYDIDGRSTNKYLSVNLWSGCGGDPRPDGCTAKVDNKACQSCTLTGSFCFSVDCRNVDTELEYNPNKNVCLTEGGGYYKLNLGGGGGGSPTCKKAGEPCKFKPDCCNASNAICRQGFCKGCKKLNMNCQRNKDCCGDLTCRGRRCVGLD